MVFISPCLWHGVLRLENAEVLHGPLCSSTEDAKLNALGIGSEFWKVNYQILAGRKEEQVHFLPLLPLENEGEELGSQNALS